METQPEEPITTTQTTEPLEVVPTRDILSGNNETLSTKDQLIKSLASIFQEALPFIVIGLSISTTILQYINQDCKFDPTIMSFIAGYNNTAISSILNENTGNVLSKVLVVFNVVFAFLMSIYYKYIKEANVKFKIDNSNLSEEITKLTAQNIFVGFGSNYGPVTERDEGDPLNASVSTGYPTALNLTTPNEPYTA